jgi:DNA-binding response OmpR family regulator
MLGVTVAKLQSNAGSGMRILIVEDEPRIADFLQRGLTAEGHFCVVANDGESGLALAMEGDFDLLLLDLLLPRLHGHGCVSNCG